MRWGLRIAVAVGAVLIVAGSAGAQPESLCVVTVNRALATDHSEPGSAYAVDADGVLDIAVVATSEDPIRAAKVELQFGPVRLPLTDERVEPTPAWVGRFNVADGARYGVGLYGAVATARLSSGRTCSGAMWFEVTGRSPFTTFAGIAGTAVAVLGLLIAVGGMSKAAQGSGGLVAAVIGGAMAGIGALVVAQQSGTVPIDGDSVALWVLAPGATGAALQQVVARLGGRAPRPEPPPEIPATAPRPAPAPATDRPATAAPEAPTEAFPTTAPAEAPAEAFPEATAAAEAPTQAMPEPTPAPTVPSKGVPEATAAPETAPAAAPDDTGEPPRTAYARLDCPDAVLPETKFDLIVGLAATRSVDVVGDELRVPESVRGPYTLTIQVVADGFELSEGDSWRVQLPVTAADPYPAATLHLTARGSAEAIAARAIRAMFSIEGQTMGMAFRSVIVVRNPDLLKEAGIEEQEPGVDLSIPTSWTAPDLTVRIVEGESENGRLLWTFETPHGGIAVPDEPLVSHVGDGEEPRAFARRVVDAVNAREGRPGLYQYLVGVARSIADEMPERFWQLWSEVATQTKGRPPSVLILSEEPYIPWELAETRPPIDDAAPPFLSAQAVVGRWVLGHRRPKLPPPMETSITPMAVIWGVYNRPGWNRLVKAEEEASEFTESYGATSVNAAANDVLKCLEGSPPADLMHFAVHGIYDPTGTEDGLVLTDGHVLDPLQVKGSTFSRAPFVFLNACQVGSGNKILGDYAGLANAFLYSGAAGVVAPLWSVQDTIAKDLALSFYAKAFGGAGVGEVLRSQRAQFIKSDDPISATYLAYQYFGHPEMRIKRVLPLEEGESWQSSTQTETPSASATS
jgi:hypothetical protein